MATRDNRNQRPTPRSNTNGSASDNAQGVRRSPRSASNAGRPQSASRQTYDAAANASTSQRHVQQGAQQRPQSSSHRAARATDAQRTADDVARYSRNSYGTKASNPDPVSQGSYRAAFDPNATKHGSGVTAQQYSRNGAQYQSGKKRGGAGKKVAIALLIILVIGVIGAIAATVWYINGINNDLKGGKSDEELAAIDQQLTASRSFNEPFYVILIGSDARVYDESMGQRSDTNIVTRVDPTTNTVTMVSIPRDTMIYLSGVGTTKFNATYYYEGAAGVIREAKNLTGVEISHYAEIDFDGLINLVDAIGGVDVYVDELIDDEDAGNIVINEGEQHLNGEAALVFARSRAYADGDFTRVSNQRKLIQAIVNKVMSLPLQDLPGTIQAGARCVSTDLSVQDLLDLALQMRDKGEMTIYSATIPAGTDYIDEISYVIADTAATKEMMRIVDEGGDPNSIYG